MAEGSLWRRIAEIGREAGAEALAVAYYDYRSRAGWSHHGDAWFHAASTIKVPVLVAFYRAAEAGRFAMGSRLHVRNRFLSVADGEPYTVRSDRDSGSAVQAQVGRTMPLGELAHHMITTSSNLATNLLVDLVGVDHVRETLAEIGVEGIDFRRGVEDERAWEAGINNRVTADGLLALLRAIVEKRAVSEQACGAMLDILHEQEFSSGIPAGLPDDARVAHKTGEISTVAHDAGVVYLPEREPYALVILTQWPESRGGRHETIARVSRTIFEHVSGGDEEEGPDE